MQSYHAARKHQNVTAGRSLGAVQTNLIKNFNTIFISFFFIAAVNSHKLDVLDQYKFIFSEF